MNATVKILWSQLMKLPAGELRAMAYAIGLPAPRGYSWGNCSAELPAASQDDAANALAAHMVSKGFQM